MRTNHAAQDVVGLAHRSHPVTHRLIGGILQRAAASSDFIDLRTHQPHAEHIERLPADVFHAHINLAGQTEVRTRGSGGHAVLTGTGLSDDSLLTHAHG